MSQSSTTIGSGGSCAEARFFVVPIVPPSPTFDYGNGTQVIIQIDGVDAFNFTQSDHPDQESQMAEWSTITGIPLNAAGDALELQVFDNGQLVAPTAQAGVDGGTFASSEQGPLGTGVVGDLIRYKVVCEEGEEDRFLLNGEQVPAPSNHHPCGTYAQIDALKELRPKAQKTHEKCFERCAPLVDSNQLEDEAIQPFSTNPEIILTPSRDGVLKGFLVRIDNATLDNREFSFTLDGAPLPNWRIQFEPNAPDEPGPNLPEGRYQLIVDFDEPISVTAGQTLTIGLAGPDAADTVMGWTSAGNDDSGQANFVNPVAGQFPQVRIYQTTTERWSECFFDDGTSVKRDPFGNEVADIPADALPVQCACGCNEPEPEQRCCEIMQACLKPKPDAFLNPSNTVPRVDFAGVSPDIGQTLAASVAFREGFDLTQAPTGTTQIGTLSLIENDPTPNRTNVQVIGPDDDNQAFVSTMQDVIVRWTAGTEGYVAVELGLNCGDLALIDETHNGVGDNNTAQVAIPAGGIHRIRVWNIDSGGSSSSWNAVHSIDGGATFSAGLGPVQLSNTTTVLGADPIVKVCDDGSITDVMTGEAVPLTHIDLKAPEPEPVVDMAVNIGGIDIPNSATAFAFPFADVITFTITNEGATDVLVNTPDGVVTIHQGGSRTWGTGENRIDTSAITIDTGANSNADLIWER